MTVRLTDIPALETERLILRAPEGRDLEGWTAMATSERARYIGGPYTPALAFRAWGHVIGQWCIRGFGSYVFERRDTGAAIGHGGPWYPEGWPEHEIGWVIWDPACEGKGYAAEAARALIDHAFGTLGWDTAVSYIDADNLRSIALAERLGAVRDDAAPKPDKDDPPVVVYRHPGPTEFISNSYGIHIAETEAE